MNTWLTAFIMAIIGASGGAIVGGTIKAVKIIRKSNKDRISEISSLNAKIDSMVTNGKNRGNETKALFKIQDFQNDGILSIAESQKAILEVVSSVRDNGNVDDAFKRLEAGKESILEAKKTYRDTMLDKVGFQEAGK